MTLQKQTVLVVDDTPANIEILNGILSPNYKIRFALNGEKALQIAGSSPPPDIILLDVMMPGMNGYEVCRKLKANPETRDIPVIFVTAVGDSANEAQGFELGAVDYITKPVNAPVVQSRVRTHLALYDQNRELERKVAERTRDLDASRLEIVKRLGRAGEYKDNETGLHVVRMSHYSRLLGEAAGLAKDDINILFNAAPMHDIGKIGIPDSIMLKPGPLDDQEWNIMKKHPLMGAQIIGEHNDSLLTTARLIALTHHEKWDGSGYPQQLQGEEIPLAGRIVAIADVFDALTSERPYKKAWTTSAAVELISAESGKHFDPKLVPLFQQILAEILEIKGAYAESIGPV